MALKKKPVTGMKDILPAEMQVRDYVMNQIRETYRGFGFSPIETPCVEHIENLTSKQGGDNEKLIFKILKRGEKLNLETAETENDLTDSGLRYDLTVPLSRYYANNAANLLRRRLRHFRWAAYGERTGLREGRFRQFVQCDIDILGDPTRSGGDRTDSCDHHAARESLAPRNTTVRINDGNILKGMAAVLRIPGGIL